MTIPAGERKVASNGVIGMLLVLITEAMFFAGLISAYIVNRAGAMEWPPADQPRLPVGVTAIDTVVLISSAVSLYLFRIRSKKHNYALQNSRGLLVTTLILGATFLAIQGSEWVKLIGYGLTAHSSLYGAFFYTLIGIHGAHVLVGLSILLYLFFKLRRNGDFEVSDNRIIVCSMYWYFVVAIWPILYILVYLS